MTRFTLLFACGSGQPVDFSADPELAAALAQAGICCTPHPPR